MVLMRPLDFSCAPARDWLEALDTPETAAVRAVAARLERAFVLGSPWAPGYVFVGGQISTQTALGGAHRFSLSGGGLEPADALLACLGEGAERLATVAHPTDIVQTAPITNASAAMWPPAHDLIDPSMPGTFAWSRVADAAGAAVGWVPTSWLVRLAAPDALLPAGIALSTGVAAGPTVAFARERALLELIERDAAALWWRGGRRGRPVAMDQPAALAATQSLAELRQGAQDRVTWLLDLTTDLGVPVIAAVSFDADTGRRFAVGLSARRSATDAVRSAILELLQTELSIQLVEAKRSARGDLALTPADQITLQRANAIDAAYPLVQPLGGSRTAQTPIDIDLAAHLATLGIATAFVDLTRVELPVPVVRALAPALQPYPGGRVTVRLAAVMEAVGDGDRLSGGVSLM